MTQRPEAKRLLKPLAAGLSLSAIFIAVLSIPLEAAAELGLGSAETSVWIMVVWGLPSLLTLVFIARYRQPLVLTGNIFVIIFVLLLGGELPWSVLVGATMVAGAIVLALGLAGLTHRIASLLPSSIVYGLLAGAVLGLLADSIDSLGTSTLLVGATFAAYFVSRATLGDRFPALLTAFVVGVAVALLASLTGPPPDPRWPTVAFTLPEFTLQAIVTATPIMVVFISLQANAPSIVYLRSQGYDPPERVASLVSGGATMLGSFFGPIGVSLSLPATALVAGPDAGHHDARHWAGYVAAGVGLVIALASGFAADLIGFIPGHLLGAIVGLAVLGILAQSLNEITKGPLLMGPLVAFAVAVSHVELFGLGRFFWAIVFGLGVSALLERDAWKGIHARSVSPQREAQAH